MFQTSYIHENFLAVALSTRCDTWERANYTQAGVLCDWDCAQKKNGVPMFPTSYIHVNLVALVA